MAYDNNKSYTPPPAAIKPDITPWIPNIHELTENKWKDNELRLTWNNQPAAMPPDDFMRMMYIAAKRGLDPLLRQVYATCRFSKKEQKYLTTIEATIDGFRLACDLTGEVLGMSEPRFAYAQDGSLLSCSITLYRNNCPNGFTATAFLAEYIQTDFNGNAVEMWRKMPHAMLAKCCEALVRRMAFPAALSGIYAKEEMMQADSEVPAQIALPTATVAEIPAPVAVAYAPIPAPQVPAVQAPVTEAPAPAPQPVETAKRTRRPRATEPVAAPAPAPEYQPVQVSAPIPPPPPPIDNFADFGEAPQAPAPVVDKYVCSDTGQPIADWVDQSTGTAYNRDWIYEYSVRNVGRALCAQRLLALKQESHALAAQTVANQAAQILNGQVNGVAA